MDIDGDGIYDAEYMDDLHPAVEQLKPVFARLMQKRLDLEESTIDGAVRREAIEEIFKEQMREAFLTHAIATEADFERLWPRLRDDTLCEHTATVFFQVIDALAEDLDDES